MGEEEEIEKMKEKEREKKEENEGERGVEIMEGINKMKEKKEIVGEVRGKGMMEEMEIV